MVKIFLKAQIPKYLSAVGHLSVQVSHLGNQTIF